MTTKRTTKPKPHAAPTKRATTKRTRETPDANTDAPAPAPAPTPDVDDPSLRGRVR